MGGVKTTCCTILCILGLTSIDAVSAVPGDISGDGTVTIAEVQTSINAFLGLVGDNPYLNKATAFKTVSLQSDAQCTNGGISISSGIDKNGNGILDDTEVSSTGIICNGTIGPQGVTGLAGLQGPKGDQGAAGPTGPQGPSGSGLQWVDVTTTTAQAASNTGYLANSASQVTITLPPTPSIGDIIQVTGVADGGWKIAQNSNQSVITTSIPSSFGLRWSLQGPVKNWISVASSSDGRKLLAAAIDGQLYTSNDFGATWTARETVRHWYSVASSADGTKLVAGDAGGLIYTSSDSGVTWISRGKIAYWEGIASSSDGTKLVAAASRPGGIGGLLYTSADSGVTWTEHLTEKGWWYVASSADGTKLAASGENGVYTSADSGTTWTATTLTGWDWQKIVSSADGNKLVVVGRASVDPANVYTSSDAGRSWTSLGMSGYWESVASSADGKKIVLMGKSRSGAPDIYSKVYVSTDSGGSWNTTPLNGVFNSAALSSNGTNVIIAEAIYNGGVGRLYTSFQSTSKGETGSFSGGKYDSISLQYVGNNFFTIQTFAGDLLTQ